MANLFLSNLWTGEKEKLEPKRSYHLSSLDRYRIMIELDDQDEVVELWVNDQKILLPENYLPIYVNREGHCTLKVVGSGRAQRFNLDVPKHTLLDHNSLLPALKLFAKRSEHLLIQETIDKLLTLPFFSPSVIEDTLNDSAALQLDNEIYAVIPSLFKVCARPRRSLISEKRVMPIDKVKRISANSLEHLASHPHLWQSRSLSGIKPLRLRTDVPEETLDLYENRVVSTLIRRLLQYLFIRSREVDRAYYQTEALHENLFTDYCYNRFRDDRFRQLWSNQVELIDNYDQVHEFKIKIDTLLSQVSSSLDSVLYKALPTHADVTSPLKPTNILLMDEDYHKLFKLWQKLDDYVFNRDFSKKMSIESDPQANYFQYIYGCVLLALRWIGFGNLKYSDEISKNNNVLCLDHWKAVVNLEKDRSIISIKLTSENTENLKKGYCKYIFVMPSVRCIAGDISQVKKDIKELKELANHFLSDFFDDPKLYRREQIDISASLIIAHLTDLRDRRSLGESVSHSLIRQMLSIGNNFLEKVTYELKEKRLGAKAKLSITPIGMIPASPLDINTLERFQHLFLFHTLGHDLIQDIPLVQCPVCHGNNLKSDSSSGSCQDCKAKWSLRTCPNCQGKVPNLEPGKPLKRKDYTDQPYSVYAMALEQLMGRDQLSPICESHDFHESQRVRVICPHCGVCPGRGETLAKCERCGNSEVEKT
jgi:hypothetical protein